MIPSFEGAMYAFEVALGFTEQDTKDVPIFCAISAGWEF